MLCSVVQLRVITHAMQLLLAMQLNIDVTDRWGAINGYYDVCPFFLVHNEVQLVYLFLLIMAIHNWQVCWTVSKVAKMHQLILGSV